MERRFVSLSRIRWNLAKTSFSIGILVGCEVVTVEDQRLGTVREVFRAGENENLVVDGNGKEYMIPFAKAICLEVDLENKIIKVDPPEGLLEF